MPVCSYLVIPREGADERLAKRLADLPHCDVARAEEGNVLLLVTDAPGPVEDRELRRTLEGLEGIHALILTFGEIDPDTEEADPLASERGKRRRLPVVDPGGLGLSGDPPGHASDREEP